MRSVFVFLKEASEPEVATFLSANYLFWPETSRWMAEKEGDPVLYIDFYHDFNIEGEVEEWFALLEFFGGEPVVIVGADVATRYDGIAEVSSFVCGLLRAFNGVASDDYTFHLWSCSEIEANVEVEGHPFFDTLGRYHIGPSV